MKIVTIGGTGFIGHQLSKDLSELGHSVTSIDNHSDYGTLDRKELDWLIPARMARMPLVRCITGDANDHGKMRSFLRELRPDWIVYLAAFPRAKAVDDNLVIASDTMITALVNVAEIAKEIDAKILFVSSSMVYGEWPAYEIDESHPPDPKGMYGLLKHCGEKILSEMMDPFKLLITRLTGVYGPWDATDRVVSRMFRAALRSDPITVHGASMMLDLTYITDTVAAMVKGIERDAHGIYNISSGTGTTLLSLASEIHRLSNSESEIVMQAQDPRYKQRGALNHSRASRDLDYICSTDLETGLGAYLRWLTDEHLIALSKRSTD